MVNYAYQEGDHVNKLSNGWYCWNCNSQLHRDSLELPMPDQPTDCEVHCAHQFRMALEHHWPDVEIHQPEFRIIKDTCFNILTNLKFCIMTFECKDAFLLYNLRLMGLFANKSWRTEFLVDHTMRRTVCSDEMMDRFKKLAEGKERRQQILRNITQLLNSHRSNGDEDQEHQGGPRITEL